MTCYVKDTPFGRMFICGDLGPQCSRCADLGTLLCDYPVGEAKTCDASLCETHGNKVAPDVHYCPGHFNEWTAFRAAGGVKAELMNVVPFALPKDYTP